MSTLPDAEDMIEATDHVTMSSKGSPKSNFIEDMWLGKHFIEFLLRQKVSQGEYVPSLSTNKNLKKAVFFFVSAYEGCIMQQELVSVLEATSS